jgi:hypothetical protein
LPAARCVFPFKLVTRSRNSAIIRGREKDMTVHKLVSEFYGRVWNAGDRAALDDLLSDGFTFQGSLGPEVAGRDAFW